MSPSEAWTARAAVDAVEAEQLRADANVHAELLERLLGVLLSFDARSRSMSGVAGGATQQKPTPAPPH
jgi:hypothetical protein